MKRQPTLRRKAIQGKLSFDQSGIEESATATERAPKRANFRDLAGRWTPDPEFDAITVSQRQIHPDKWS